MIQDPSKPTSEKSISDVIAPLSAALPLVGAACVAVSICREFAYFYVVGLQFMPILTTSDYLRASIFWLPLTLGSWAVGSFYGYISRMQADHLESQLEKSPNKENAISFVMMNLSMTVLGVALVGQIFYYVIYLKVFFFQFIIVFLFCWLINFLMRRYPIPAWILRLTINSIIVLSISFAHGLSQGDFDMKSGTVMSIKGGFDSADRDVRAMRFVDRGVFFRKPGTAQIEFVPWDEVKGVRYEGAPHWTVQSGRQLFGYEPASLPDAK